MTPKGPCSPGGRKGHIHEGRNEESARFLKGVQNPEKAILASPRQPMTQNDVIIISSCRSAFHSVVVIHLIVNPVSHSFIHLFIN